MNTRDRILKLLVSQQRQTINELADSVGINPISVRHHISKLEADGSVDSEEERHGVGRPRRIYFLTESGMELFPSRYLNLSNRLLDQIKKDVPKKTIDNLLRNMAGDIANDFIADVQIEKLDIDDRILLLDKILTREGFIVEIEKHDDKVYINETSCPYIHVGQDHHEVCILDETFIHNILGAPVEQIQCMLDGDGLCTYEVAIIPSSRIEIRS